MTRQSFLRSLAGALAFCGCLVAQPSVAQVGADLNISPKRLVFDGATRAATAYLFNRGTAPAVYTIDTVDRYMADDGQVLPAKEASTPADLALVAKVKSAQDFVTLTPRRVTLPPGGSQTIRLRVLRPAGLETGEYRTHLTITALPPEDIGLTAEQALRPPEAGELSARVVGLFSISVPIIVRQGPGDARAAIENLAYSAETVAGVRTGVVTFNLARLGAHSVYGDVEVAAGKDKHSESLGLMRGVAVYTEVEKRPVRIVLSRPARAGEQLVVSFKSDDINAGTVLATAATTAP